MIEDTLSTIYALVDPRTEEVRYIGKTYKGIENRRTQHIAKGRVVSEETKQKLSAIFTNRVVSADTKQKMSAAAKIVWAARKENKQKKEV